MYDMNTSTPWFVVTDDTIRPHFCSSYYLAQAVVKNLRERYGIEPKISGIDSDRAFHFSVGLMSNRPPTKVMVLPDKLTLSWLLSEELFLRKSVEDFPLQKGKYDGQFYKIHSHSGTVCLTLQQGDILYDCVVNRKPNSSYLKEQ